MHAGATCALLPKKHQAAWHRPDDTKRSTGLDGSQAYNPRRQAEWKIDNNAECAPPPLYCYKGLPLPPPL